MLDVANVESEREISKTKAASFTLKNALERVAPVIKTAGGGALVVGSALVMRDLIIPHWNDPSPAGIIKPLLASIGAQSIVAGIGGVAMMKKPVGEAINFFRSKLSQKPTK